MGFNCLKTTATSRRQFTFYHSVPRNSWYSFYQPRKDERLSQPRRHSVVLITGPLDWEFSTLATRPLLCSMSYKNLFKFSQDRNSTMFHKKDLIFIYIYIYIYYIYIYIYIHIHILYIYIYIYIYI